MFLEPETDVMVQFLAPEIVIMGERNFMQMVNDMFRREHKVCFASKDSIKPTKRT
jgi:hypothetical protein